MQLSRWKTWLLSLAASGTAAGVCLLWSAQDAASQDWGRSRVQQTNTIPPGAQPLPPQTWNAPANSGLQLSNWPTRTGVQNYAMPIVPYAGYRAGNDPMPYNAARNPAGQYSRGVAPIPYAPIGSQPQQANYSPIQSTPPAQLPNITPPWAMLPNDQRSEAIDLASFETGRHTAQYEVTPRARVSAGSWSGPSQKSLGPLPGVHFDNPYQDDSPAEDYVSPYFGRTGTYPDQEMSAGTIDLVELPADFAPWWDAVINQPMRAGTATSQQVGVESLTMAALEHSPQVTAIRIDPAIREAVICEEQAFFDWTAFLDTTYDDKNDPVGNTLTTGGASRFSDKIGASRGGFRKRTINGGRFDVAQRLAWEQTNSNFFVPNPQGQTRLEMNFTQPLMRGAGYVYNQSRIVLAEVDKGLSQQEMLEKLQDHLVQVYDTYWLIYKSRAVRLQKERLLGRAKQIQEQLEARRGVDSIRRQILRASAAVASRKAEIARAEMAIRNSESRLRLLVNSPDLKRQTQVELLPADLPLSQLVPISMKASAESALQHRPDIKAAIQKMKGTSVQLNMAKNEFLPKLDLVLSTYTAGLQGKGDTAAAFGNQFTDGRPGFGVGLLFEYPLGNRAAGARQDRREWEVAKALKDFEATIETSLTDVEIAVREMETSYREMLARFQSMIAAETEASYLQERWRLLPGNDQTLSFLLEDVLDAQERVTTEEQDFVTAQVNYVLSLVRVKRAMGVLLSM